MRLTTSLRSTVRGGHPNPFDKLRTGSNLPPSKGEGTRPYPSPSSRSISSPTWEVVALLPRSVVSTLRSARLRASAAYSHKSGPLQTFKLLGAQPCLA
jgi:hypothetical protein